MSQTVRDVMTTDLVTCPSSAPVMDAAGHMRDRNIGDVLVVDDGSVRGIVTDRDIVVRCVADGGDVRQATVGDVCSATLTTVASDAVDRGSGPHHARQRTAPAAGGRRRQAGRDRDARRPRHRRRPQFGTRRDQRRQPERLTTRRCTGAPRDDLLMALVLTIPGVVDSQELHSLHPEPDGVTFELTFDYNETATRLMSRSSGAR